MFRRFSTNYMAVLFILDSILIQCALWVAIQLRFILPFGQTLRPEWVNSWVYLPSYSLHLAIAALWMLTFLALSVYVPRHVTYWYDEFSRILLAHTIAALSFAGMLYFADIALARLTYLYFYALVLLALVGYRSLLRLWHRHHRSSEVGTMRVLVVGAGKVGCDVVAELNRHPWPGVQMVGFLDDAHGKPMGSVSGLPVLGTIDEALAVIDRYNVNEVMIALPQRAHSRVANLVAALYEKPVQVHVVPDYFELAFFGATVETLGSIPMIGLRDPAIDGLQRFVKRLFDIVLSSLIMLVLAPLFMVVALAIKLEDGGPVFYGAARVGENGRLFRMLKFRSMVVGADRMQIAVNQTDDKGHVVHKQPNDPRVTRIGRFLRRTSIDELPQLINVLKGEMSLVGPRPELPWLVEKYQPWQRKRFAVPQGITGWWQINGRSDNLMHLHTEQDLYYIQNYSLWLDIQILWRTLFVVFRGKGAY